MNRAFLFLAPIAAAFTAFCQARPALPAPPANIVKENSKVSRFLAGPGRRLQGFLLRNGTFVISPPGLSRQLPPTMAANASISVTGSESSFEGNRTIPAKPVSIAGMSYENIPSAMPAKLLPPVPSIAATGAAPTPPFDPPAPPLPAR